MKGPRTQKAGLRRRSPGGQPPGVGRGTALEIIGKGNDFPDFAYCISKRCYYYCYYYAEGVGKHYL